jgi:hypothetical protein
MQKNLAESEKSPTCLRQDAKSVGAKRIIVQLKAGTDYGKSDTEASKKRGENKERIYVNLKTRADWSKLTPLQKYDLWIEADGMLETFDNLDIEKRHPRVVSDVLSPLEKLAREGRRDSLHLLALFAYEAASKLNSITSEHPEFARLVSGYFLQWPVLCNGVRELPKDQYELLVKLGMLHGDLVLRDFRRFPELLRRSAGTAVTPLKRLAILLFCWLDNCSSPWSARKQIQAGKATKRSSHSDHDFESELRELTGGKPTAESLDPIQLAANNAILTLQFPIRRGQRHALWHFRRGSVRECDLRDARAIGASLTRIHPSENSELMRPDQLFLSPSTENAPGLSLVASFLSQDTEGRRLVTEVMKVRALDEQRWLSLLRQALNSIAAPRTAEEPWRNLWNKLRASPTNIRACFLDENKGMVRVRRRDSQWVAPEEALLTGRIVREDDPNEANKLMLVDLGMHSGDEELLSSIGVSDNPHGDIGPGSHAAILKESQGLVLGWISFCRLKCLQLHPNPADPSYLEPKSIAMPKGWTLLASLNGNASVALTKILLRRIGAAEFSPTVTFGHRTNQHYPLTPVSHPLLWLLCKHGRLAVSNSSVRVAALVKHRDTPAVCLMPDWDHYQAAISLLVKVEPEAPATTHDSRELWEALIDLRTTPESLAGDELGPLWNAAAKSEVVPKKLPWQNGIVPLYEIFVSESLELTRRTRTSGRLAVTLDAETLKTWIEHGAQVLDHLLKPRFLESVPPAPLITLFPELGSVLHDDFRGTASSQSVSKLELCLDGQGEQVACLFWKDTMLVDREQLSSNTKLSNCQHSFLLH